MKDVQGVGAVGFEDFEDAIDEEAAEAGGRVVNKFDDACFGAGTPVPTASGVRPIEAIERGDRVKARNPSTGEVAFRRVEETTTHHEERVLRLGLESATHRRVSAPSIEPTSTSLATSDSLVVTGEHPFWRRAVGWVPARRLESGDEVFTSRGGWWKVTSSTWLQGRRTVHNLEVADFHTYFVGASRAWVHNTCPWLGKNIRISTKSNSSKEYTVATSDLDGGMKKAIKTFENLTGKKPKMQNPNSMRPTDVYKEANEIEVYFRPSINTGTPVIQVKDHGTKTIEKIHVNP